MDTEFKKHCFYYGTVGENFDQGVKSQANDYDDNRKWVTIPMKLWGQAAVRYNLVPQTEVKNIFGKIWKSAVIPPKMDQPCRFFSYYMYAHLYS